MIPWNLLDLDRALRASWAADTCSSDDQPEWTPCNPGLGALRHHCLDRQRCLRRRPRAWGGARLGGDQRGFHRWNRLSSGVELDLMREQFQRGEHVTAASVVDRPPGPLRRWEEYLLLRERVMGHLGRLPEPAA